MFDTLTFAKMVHSDELSYGLERLATSWLGLPEWKKELTSKKDHSENDVEDEAEYATTDIINTRLLYQFIEKNRYDAPIWQIEKRLTRVLYEMEVRGLAVDPLELKKDHFVFLSEAMEHEEFITEQFGFRINPSSSRDCHHLFVEVLGMPIVEWTEKGNPSFDKSALEFYERNVKKEFQEAVSRLKQWKKINTLLSMFIIPFLELHENGIVHPDINQSVRTGRMSSRQPNSMALSLEAKKYIHPRSGLSFASYDYSQIEFRLIAEYIDDEEAIKQYNQDPDTDFHEWVTSQLAVKVDRTKAKRVNFGMAYGAGRNKVTSELASSPEMIEMFSQSARNEQHLKSLCATEANKIYDAYHRRFPGMKIHGRLAQSVARRRGYVRTKYGRRRYLHPDFARKGFNSVIQGSAADITKDRLVAIFEDETLRREGITVDAVVHDEFLFSGPEDALRSHTKHIQNILQTTSVAFRIPIVVSFNGFSNVSWAGCFEAKEKPYTTVVV